MAKEVHDEKEEWETRWGMSETTLASVENSNSKMEAAGRAEQILAKKREEDEDTGEEGMGQ